MAGVRTTFEEKQQLDAKLEEVYSDPAAEWQFFVMVMIVIAIVLLLTLPKIYLRNAIYYESRKIDRLRTEYGALLEENRLLRRKVESLQVKNQVLDTIF